MPTIKTKKEMTLSELVEYGFNNPKKIRGKIFKPQSFDSFWNPVDVRFSDDGCAVNVNGTVTDEDVYTIEIEEQITEDTQMPKLIEIGIGDFLGYSAVNENISISEITNKKSLALYVLNEDYSMTLVYKNGKLVE
ncbi:hypothetical protein [Mammaliicoccus sciuri]|uniref:hypothetical protein n=1 Tax=Mammaliicoccus sciuri TaxID=1296 RepID=UPI002DBDD418|nr:hypothetical protein [Mammaliicoccus sciuri]MEB6232522.1 hypothetical protein [Mammaliicoccus sciuri]